MENSETKQNKEVIVKNLEELSVFAGDFISFLKEFSVRSNVVGVDGGGGKKGGHTVVVGLSGDLGAGKTTFSQSIAKLLGIKETVTSPTFGIQKQYKVQGYGLGKGADPETITQDEGILFKEFIHIDAYRIEDIKEVGTLRFVELFQKPNTLIFIEWPEKIQEILPKDTLVLSFESIDENTRKISY